MKIFICPDKFKGSASSQEVIEAIEQGLRKSEVSSTISSTSISDGGDGFSLIASQHLDGEWVKVDSEDALHRPIEAEYFIADSTAFIDMSNTNGLVQISPQDRNPMLSSTYGTGLLLKDAALRSGIKKIYIGLGGSATNDGGAGMATALGASFNDFKGNKLTPVPNELIHCSEIDLSQLISLPPIVAACDVNNPLLGENGATYIYGPQKGVIELDDTDSILANLMLVGAGEHAATVPGAGAAGGIAYGLLHYCGASLESGFDIVAQIIQLEEKIKNADIIITGEGSLDSQTLNGKGPHGIANLAKKHGKRVFAIAGHVEDVVKNNFEKTYSLSDLKLPLETCMEKAAELITDQAEKLAEDYLKR